MKHKPLPIGVEDFKRLVDNEYYFVDKTLMIKELLENKGSIFSPDREDSAKHST